MSVKIISLDTIGQVTTVDDLTIDLYGLSKAGDLSPYLSGQPYMGQTLTLNSGNLTAPYSFHWLIDGIKVEGYHKDTLALSMANGVSMMSMIVGIVCGSEGCWRSAPVMPMHMHAEASHTQMDQAVMALVSPEQVTITAVQDGLWSAASTWDLGRVPQDGDLPRIAMGVTVDYDVLSNPARLHRLRVDGDLILPTDQYFHLLAETIVVTPPGNFDRGGSPLEAGLDTYEGLIEFCNNTWAEQQINPGMPSDLDFADDPTLISRGLLILGSSKIYATRAKTFARTVIAPLTGDTDVTFEGDGFGWQVGHDIEIAGTIADRAANSFYISQRERRTITSIVESGGNTQVFWTDALIYDHDHQNSTVSSAEVDAENLKPHAAYMYRNIVMRTENGTDLPPYQKAHSMAMHMMARLDWWGVQFDDMGRTNKRGRAGVIKSDGQFHFVDPAGTGKTVISEPVTAQSNLQSRYPVHLHIMGFETETAPRVYNCLVTSTPGWAYVHHGCAANFVQNVGTNFRGAGMVSETGDELEAWVNNFMYGQSEEGVSRLGGNKTIEDDGGGSKGDFGRHGVAFMMRGRAMRVNGNVGADCSHAYDFYHRGGLLNDASNLQFRLPVPRAYADMSDLETTKFDEDGVNLRTHIMTEDYPILHFNENEGYGVAQGVNITKSDGKQNHDLNIHLKNFKIWACHNGAWIEYIAAYLIENFTCYRQELANTPSGNDTLGNRNGIVLTQTEQIAVVGAKCVGFDYSLDITSSSLPSSGLDSDNFSQDDWRFFVSDLDSTHAVGEVQFTTGDANGTPTNTAEDVTVWLTTRPTEVPVTTTLPFIYATWDGGTYSYTASGARKYDSYSHAVQNGGVTNLSGATLMPSDDGLAKIPKTWDGLSLTSSATPVRALVEEHGYHTYDDSGTMRNILVVPHYFSDRIFAVPYKFWHAIELTGDVSDYTNNGAYTISANAPVCPDINLTVPSDDEVTIDVVGNATDADGDVLTLERAFYAPDFGKAHPDTDTGEITFTRDAGHLGDDSMFAWISDGTGHSTLTRINITSI